MNIRDLSGQFYIRTCNNKEGKKIYEKFKIKKRNENRKREWWLIPCLINIILSFAVGNTSKSRVEPEAAETLENVEKQAPLVTRSLPRRCLSMEGATSNYRTNLAQPLRPSPTYLELENSRRSQFSKSRRYKTNYPTGK